MKSILYPAIVLAILLVVVPARPDEDKRKEFIENLFRNILEAQRGRQPFPAPGIPIRPGAPQPGAPQPGAPQPGAPQPGAPQPVPPPNSQGLAQYRNLIQSYSQQLSTLTNNLSQESARAPQLRSHLPELYSIRTRALSLHQNCGSVSNLATITPEFQALDTSWRSLSFQLQANPAVDAGCRRNSRQIDKLGAQICDLLGIRADFDRTRAVFLSGQASAYLDSLVDVLQQSGGYHRGQEQLVREGRQLAELARQLGHNVASLPLEDAIETCRSWGDSWSVYSAKLQAYQTPAATRAVARVRQSQSELYDLMRIQRSVDYDQLRYITRQTRQAVQILFGRLSIGHLGPLPRQQVNALFAAQRNLEANLQNFSASLQGSPDPETVAQSFLKLETSWQNCIQFLGGLTGQVAGDRATVESHLQEMRNLLAISDPVHGGLTLSKAAALEALASALYNSVAQQSQQIRSHGFRNRVFLVTQQFLQNCSILHAQVANGADPQSLQNTCNTLVDSWQTCSTTLQGLAGRGTSSQALQSIERARARVDPAVAEISVMLTP